VRFHYLLILLFAILIISCTDEKSVIPEINNQLDDNSLSGKPAKEIIPQNNETVERKNGDESSDFLLEKIHFKSTYFEIAEPSSVTFTVNEKLARLPLPIDAVLSTEIVKGSIDLEYTKSDITVDLHTLQSDQEKRDRYVREQLFPDQKYAFIKIDKFPTIPDEFYEGAGFETTISAIVNVNGVDAVLDFDITAQLSYINPFYSDEVLEITGISHFYWSDFNMETPKSGFFTLKDKVDVQLSFIAKSLVIRY
tara:strand:+ start:327 stop:1082 length:756 start_codon:yes stop_codon:yes gene_type:complete